jgi:hypothetical protein
MIDRSFDDIADDDVLLLTPLDELENSFSLVRKTRAISELPPSYRDAEEFARIWVANTLQCVFIS